MLILKRCRLGAWLAGLLAAVALAACTSVSLEPAYQPPPILQPEAQTATPQPVAPPAPAESAAQPAPVLDDGDDLPPVDYSEPTGHVVTLTTLMDGASVVPPAQTVGLGQLDAVYDRSTRLLRWKASWSQLSGAVTSVDFRGPAGPGETAPTTLIWAGPYGSEYEGRATLTPDQERALLRGRWYVNVATDSRPNGEIRGQVRVVR